MDGMIRIEEEKFRSHVGEVAPQALAANPPNVEIKLSTAGLSRVEPMQERRIHLTGNQCISIQSRRVKG